MSSNLQEWFNYAYLYLDHNILGIQVYIFIVVN